jgi:hypothetical protein
MLSRRPTTTGYTELKLDLVLSTLETLQRRIEERFPGSGLGQIASDLRRLGLEIGGVVEKLRRPDVLLRAGVAVSMVLVLSLAAAPFFIMRRMPFELLGGMGALVQAVEAATQDVIFLAIAVWFLFTLEGRVKRQYALDSLHRLRSVVHVVDMHQLTKDPEHLLSPGMATPSSPERRLSRFELSRYLDYCSELLSLTTKLAALHVQSLRDPVVLEAVSDIEVLAANLGAKMWQKIDILDTALRAEELSE